MLDRCQRPRRVWPASLNCLQLRVQLRRLLPDAPPDTGAIRSGTSRPSIRPVAPFPCTIWKSVDRQRRHSSLGGVAENRRAPADGRCGSPCPRPAPAARLRVCSASGTTDVTRGLPSVSVPVLSTATARIRAGASRKAPPLISTPCRAAAARPATMVTGVEITSAHGQPITSSTRAPVKPIGPRPGPTAAAARRPRESPAPGPLGCRSARSAQPTARPVRASAAPRRPS